MGIRLQVEPIFATSYTFSHMLSHTRALDQVKTICFLCGSCSIFFWNFTRVVHEKNLHDRSTSIFTLVGHGKKLYGRRLAVFFFFFWMRRMHSRRTLLLRYSLSLSLHHPCYPVITLLFNLFDAKSHTLMRLLLTLLLTHLLHSCLHSYLTLI